MSLYDHNIETIEGKNISMRDFEGNVLLVVNVASECGFTPQYKGLQTLWQTYRDRGLVVVGVPSNDFGGQEPGSNEEILDFCRKNFQVDFPMMAKTRVKGPAANPLYQELVQDTGEQVTWNFNKFLVDRQGKVVARFDSKVEPQDARLKQAIEELL